MRPIENDIRPTEADAAHRGAEIWAFPRDEAAWRINWFGAVSYVDRGVRRQQPSVLVSLSRVTDPNALVDTKLLLNPEATNRARFQAERNVSVGTLPFMRIGDIWRNQQLILQPDYQIEQFRTLKIDRSTTALIKAGLSKDGRGFLLPLEEHPWHRLGTQSYCIEVSFGDNRRLIIPCMELIRFYFGSSSSLVSKLFLPPLLRENLYSDAQYDRVSRCLTIKLAENISGAAASDIGRLCLNQHAWGSAVAVGTSLLKGSAAGQPSFPQAFFPFEGTTDLIASGKWVSFAGTENATFVVFNLRSCSYPFPFSSLKYELQRPQGLANNRDPKSQSTVQIGAARPTNQMLVERDASTKLAEKTLKISFRHQFPDLVKKSVWKHKESQGTATAAVSVEWGVSPITEAAVGDPGSSQRIRPLNLDIAPAEDRRPPEFLRDVVEKLNKPDGIAFRLITSNGDDGWTVPVRHRYMINPCLYVDLGGGQRRLRRMGVFRRSLQGRYLYLALVEAEPVCPFFINMSETTEDKFISIATHNYILWRSKKYPDSDPMGLRGALTLVGPSLQPLVDFFVRTLQIRSAVEGGVKGSHWDGAKVVQ
jgi:hypothetical protein